MKKLIYSKKFPKQESNQHIKESFEELIHRETEDEFWLKLLKDKYHHEIDQHPLREEHIKACITFALTRKIDIGIFKGTEGICVNLSFEGLIDISELKKSIEFADPAILVSGNGGKSITLSLPIKLIK